MTSGWDVHRFNTAGKMAILSLAEIRKKATSERLWWVRERQSMKYKRRVKEEMAVVG